MQDLEDILSTPGWLQVCLGKDGILTEGGPLSSHIVIGQHHSGLSQKFPQILLMEEIVHRLGCINPLK